MGGEPNDASPRLSDALLALSLVSLLGYFAFSHTVRAFLGDALRILARATGGGWP